MKHGIGSLTISTNNNNNNTSTTLNTSPYSNKSGLRPNVFKIRFIDNGKNILSNAINAINTHFSNLKLLNTNTNTTTSEVYKNAITRISSVNDLSKYVRTISIPDRVAPDAQEIRTPFISYKLASNRQSFDTISISFVEPFGMLIKQIFKYFIFQYIINPWYNAIGDASTYKFAIEVIHYSNILKENNSIKSDESLPDAKKYTFYGVFPVTINGVNLSYDSTELVTTDVTFAYDYFEVTALNNTTVASIKHP